VVVPVAVSAAILLMEIGHVPRLVQAMQASPPSHKEATEEQASNKGQDKADPAVVVLEEVVASSAMVIPVPYV